MTNMPLGSNSLLPPPAPERQDWSPGRCPPHTCQASSRSSKLWSWSWFWSGKACTVLILILIRENMHSPDPYLEPGLDQSVLPLKLLGFSPDSGQDWAEQTWVVWSRCSTLMAHWGNKMRQWTFFTKLINALKEIIYNLEHQIFYRNTWITTNVRSQQNWVKLPF